MSTTSKHPFDFDLLNKGDVIPAEQVESLTGLKREESQFNIELMGLQQRIQDELLIRGKPVVVRCDKGSLRILTDEEAVDYTQKLFEQRRRQLGRAHGYAMRIEVSNLGDDMRISHERNIVVQGAQLAAMRDAKRLTLKAVQRKTPGLTDGTQNSGTD